MPLVRYPYARSLCDVFVQFPYAVLFFTISLYGAFVLCFYGAFARWPDVEAFYGGLERCNDLVQCHIDMSNALVRSFCDVSGLVRCGAVRVVLIVFIFWPRYDGIVAIDTDTSANYKCGHCAWIGRKTVPEDCPEPD